MQAHSNGPVWLQYVIPLVIVAIVMVIRRPSRARPLRLGLLWILPTFYLLFVAAGIAATPPHGVGWTWIAAGLLVGALVGWQRGKTTRVAVDPATREVTQQSSPLGMVLIVGLILLKTGLRAEGGGIGVDAVNLSNALLASVPGMLAVARVEIFLRARRLLVAAHAT
ncbi:CcdC protein domain-containing protein [Sphingomonas bacterium]|uniref:CcdC protein domain-containing protein n=1 Tax=Sphingomonas bacterium TaxID=1895847 RepID=UPI001576EA8D|nr:CcdC protein domain-containing protein [Sphingomonas bacterium]